MERGRREVGERLERGWREVGERLARGWREVGEMVESGWREVGVLNIPNKESLQLPLKVKMVFLKALQATQDFLLESAFENLLL